MYTVRQVGQQITEVEHQHVVVSSLVRLLRSEPLWQPDGTLDDASTSVKMDVQANFKVFAESSDRMFSAIARFHARTMRLITEEETPEVQEILGELTESLGQASLELEALRTALLGSLDALRSQDGQVPFELIEPDAN